MPPIRKALRAAALLLATTMAAKQAEAQLSFALAGGGTTPSGSISDRQNMGYNGLVAVQAGLPLIPFKVRADLQYNSFGGSSFANAFSKATAGTDSRVISGSLNAVFTLLPGPVKPYLIGGVGYYDTKFGGSGTTRKVGYNYGAGVKVTKLFIEARLHTVQNSAFDVANGRTTGKFIPISVGFMF